MATPWKHPDSGMFYVYERIPAAVVDKARGRTAAVPVGGQSITIKLGTWARFSLRTKDATVAKERYRDASAVLQEHYRLIQQEAATGPVRLTQRQVEALAGEYYRNETQQHQDNPGQPDEWDAARSALHDMGETVAGLERQHGDSANLMLQQRGMTVDDGSRKALLEAMHRAYVMFAEGQERRAVGDYTADPRAARFPAFDDGAMVTETTRPKAGQPQTDPTVSLSDLFDLWAKEHQMAGGPEKTVRDFAHKLDSLRTRLGHDDAEAVTQREIIGWCDHLRTEAKLSAKTVGDKYLTAVRAVYRIGVEKGRITAAPTDGVRVRKPKQIKTRPSGFTDEEAKTILLAALQDPSTLGNMAEKNKLAIRWTPWLGAYTGARINELTQLRKQDFITEAGIPCVRITPDAGSVKTGQYRVVPLHPHLIEMGLLEFVAAQRGEYLFLTPAETLEATSTRAENVGKKVSEWVRTGAGVTDTGVKPTHGWRHRFKTLARDVDMAPEFADAIQGHTDGRAAADYGETTVKAMYREIQKLPKYEWP